MQNNTDILALIAKVEREAFEQGVYMGRMKRRNNRSQHNYCLTYVPIEKLWQTYQDTKRAPSMVSRALKGLMP